MSYGIKLKRKILPFIRFNNWTIYFMCSLLLSDFFEYVNFSLLVVHRKQRCLQFSSEKEKKQEKKKTEIRERKFYREKNKKQVYHICGAYPLLYFCVDFGVTLRQQNLLMFY